MINSDGHLQEQNIDSRELSNFISKSFGPVKKEGVYIIELGPMEDLIIPEFKINPNDLDKFKEIIEGLPDGYKVEEQEIDFRNMGLVDVYDIDGTYRNHKYLYKKWGFFWGYFPQMWEKLLKKKKIVYVGSFSSATAGQRIMAHMMNNPIFPEPSGAKVATDFKVKKILNIIYVSNGESKEKESEKAERLESENPKWYVHSY